MKNELVRRDGRVFIICYTKGQRFEVEIDEESVELASSIKGTWCLAWEHTHYYAVTSTQKKFVRTRVKLHQLLCNFPKWPIVVDHEDGNSLNNKLSNLVPKTRQENTVNRTKLAKNNTSGYRGAFRVKNTGRFRASVELMGKGKYLGTFKTAEQAGEAVENYWRNSGFSVWGPKPHQRRSQTS